MFQPNAYAIREIMSRIPFEAFEFICDEMPYLLEIPEHKCEFIHWEEFSPEKFSSENYADENEVAVAWGYDSFEDMQENGPYAQVFDNGMLIIEQSSLSFRAPAGALFLYLELTTVDSMPGRREM